MYVDIYSWVLSKSSFASLCELYRIPEGGVLDEASKWKEAEAVALRRKEALKRKDVERRASKGRKTRYVPIPKLQNFMAPRVPEEAGEVDEELVDNLLRTLFR